MLKPRIKVMEIPEGFLLPDSHPISGFVHSCYHQVVNIQLGKRLFTLQLPHGVRTPLSLVLAEGISMDQLQLKPGQSLTLENPLLHSQNLDFDFSHAHQTAMKLFPAETEPSLPVLRKLHQDLKDFLQQFLGSSDLGLGDLACGMVLAEGFLHIETKRETPLISLILRKWDHCPVRVPDLPQRFSSLIGLGHGLTPSVDDFLTGYLAVLHYGSFVSFPMKALLEALQGEVSRRAATTTPISQAFLEAALDGNFSSVVQDFFTVLSSPQPDRHRQIFTSLAQIGHSSGIDTLNGLLFGLTCWLEFAHRTSP